MSAHPLESANSSEFLSVLKAPMPEGRDVVITGIGAVTPIGVGTESFWRALCEGQGGVRKLPFTSGCIGPENIGALIEDFDPKAFVRPRKALKVMCRELQTAFAASQLAFADSGFEAYLGQHPDFDRSRIGTVFGSEMFYGSPLELADTIRRVADDDGMAEVADFGGAAMRDIFPLWMLKYLPNMAACHVGIAVQAFGPNNTIVLGDASGPAALIESASCITRGIADVMLSGATGNRVNESGMIYRGVVPLATPRENLADSSRPFAPDRDGAVGGEAAATIVIESAELARQRGQRPLATLAGSAVRFVPGTERGSCRAIELALQAALDQSGAAFDDVGLVVSHAMGDPQQDAAELAALQNLLPQTPVCAPMAATGHCGAATGTLHLVVAVLALQNGVVPPTRSAPFLADDFPLPIFSTPQPLKKACVVVINHSAQGHATAVVLKP